MVIGLDAFQPRAPELYSPTGKVLPAGAGVGFAGILSGGLAQVELIL